MYIYLYIHAYIYIINQYYLVVTTTSKYSRPITSTKLLTVIPSVTSILLLAAHGRQPISSIRSTHFLQLQWPSKSLRPPQQLGCFGMALAVVNTFFGQVATRLCHPLANLQRVTSIFQLQLTVFLSKTHHQALSTWKIRLSLPTCTHPAEKLLKLDPKVCTAQVHLDVGGRWESGGVLSCDSCGTKLKKRSPGVYAYIYIYTQYTALHIEQSIWGYFTLVN